VGVARFADSEPIGSTGGLAVACRDQGMGGCSGMKEGNPMLPVGAKTCGDSTEKGRRTSVKGSRGGGVQKHRVYAMVCNT
jgi:hypothetical protein